MKRLFRGARFLILFSVLNAGFSAAWAAGRAAYRRVAAELSQIAQKAGIERVAILPFDTTPGVAKTAGVAVSERLISSVVAGGIVHVVERGMLAEVLKEQKLQQSGAIAPSQAKKIGKVMGVDAIVTGSLLSVDDKIEVNARLVRTETAEILGASMVQVRQEWPPEPEDATLPLGDDIIVPPPTLKLDFGGWWEKDAKAAGAGCGRWEERVDALQRTSLPVKAAYWARRLGEQGLRKKLTRNPGSEIRSLALRQEFYSTLRRLALGAVAIPSKSAIDEARASEQEAQRLIADCDQ